MPRPTYPDWITNDPEIAAQLHKAEETLQKEKDAVKDWPLKLKILAHKTAYATYEITLTAIAERIRAKDRESNL